MDSLSMVRVNLKGGGILTSNASYYLDKSFITIA